MPKNKRVSPGGKGEGKEKKALEKKSESAREIKEKSDASSVSRVTSKSRSRISSRSHTLRSGSMRAVGTKKPTKNQESEPDNKKLKSPKKSRIKLAKGSEVECNGTRYTVVELLGSGGFGDVYKVSKSGTTETYAIKTELFECNGKKIDRLKVEAAVLNSIENFDDSLRKEHFISLLDRGKTEQFKLIVMPLLGPSISDLRRYYICNEFSSTAIRVSQQALQGIWDLHVIGYLHKDIKPQNFAIGVDDKAGVVYIIDLGMAYRYIDSRTKKIKPPKKRQRFMGTIRYASRNCHRLKDQSRRDDLESWIYMSVELFNSNILPWKRMADRCAVLLEKENFFALPSQEIYSKAPDGYRSISQYVDNLSFEEEPDYVLLQKALEEIIRYENIDVTVPLDWFGYDLTKRRRRKRGVDIPNDEEAQRLSKNQQPSHDLVCVDMEAEQQGGRPDASGAQKSESALQRSSYCQVAGQGKPTTESEYYPIT